MSAAADVVLHALDDANTELELYEIAARTKLTKGLVSAAVRDLRRAQLITRRAQGRRLFYASA